MHFVVGVQTEQFGVAETDGFGVRVVDVRSDKLRPLFPLNQLLVVVLDLDHVALEILDYNLKEFYAFVGEAELEVLVDFCHDQQVEVYCVGIVDVLEQIFPMEFHELQDYAIDYLDYLFVVGPLPPYQCLVNLKHLAAQFLVDVAADVVFLH